MGEDASRCAADSFGRVQGADGLHIADCSLLPTPTVVNPQGSVMAVAHRNAMEFIERAVRRGAMRATSRSAAVAAA
jgi:choline dehydrogenase-like flavoprotein